MVEVITTRGTLSAQGDVDLGRAFMEFLASYSAPGCRQVELHAWRTAAGNVAFEMVQERGPDPAEAYRALSTAWHQDRLSRPSEN